MGAAEGLRGWHTPFSGRGKTVVIPRHHGARERATGRASTTYKRDAGAEAALGLETEVLPAPRTRRGGSSMVPWATAESTGCEPGDPGSIPGLPTESFAQGERRNGLKALPAYTLKCRHCERWWEAYPTKAHWWSREVRMFRGPFWPLRENFPKAYLSEGLFVTLYPDCYVNLEWHSLMSSFCWRGILGYQETDIDE